MVVLSRLNAQFEKGFVHGGNWTPTLLEDRLWPDGVVTSLFQESDWPWMSLMIPIVVNGPLRNLNAENPARKTHRRSALAR